VLSGVDGSSPTDVWAVGGAGREPLIEHWDGTRWKRVATASGTNAPEFLDDVAAISPDDAWAVGEGAGGLIEHWDGTSWEIVRTGVRGWLTSVSAAGPNDVWAVGTDPQQRHTIAMHWDGRSWTSHEVPEVGGRVYRMLRSVLTISADDAWAVGSTSPLGNRSVPGLALIEHWDGTRWTTVPWRQPTRDVELHAVADAGSGEIWIGGQQLVLRPRHVEATLYRLDANTFRPVTGLAAGHVDALAPAGDGRMWAVGGAFDMKRDTERSMIAERICRP
jgi:hypothetical protein